VVLGRPVAEVRQLRADHHHAGRRPGLVDQADELAAEAVADDGERLARKVVAHVGMSRGRVEPSPIGQRRAKAAQ
jgi:hypothetical protein